VDAAPDLLGPKEFQPAQVSEQTGMRFREQCQIHRAAALFGGVESDLVAEDGRAGAGRPFHFSRGAAGAR